MRCSFKPYEGNEKYIFVSYAHADGDRVKPILEKLNEAGFRIWFDEGIEWGTEWPEEIADHIAECGVCMAFHSKASAKSKNCRNEINFAASLEKSILSVYLENVQLSRGMLMQLSSNQSTFPYQYDDMSDFYERLIDTELLQGCRGKQNKSADKPIRKPIPEPKPKSGITVLKCPGECGDKLVCLYDESIQTLYIKGEGEMYDFVEYDPGSGTLVNNAPWKDLVIREVIVSPGVTDIGINAFDGCNCLESIKLPDSITRIGSCAFRGCTSLTSIKLPSGIKLIEEQAFVYCESLTDIAIPDGVTNIRIGAFGDCSSLESIEIPESVTSIDAGAFYRCTSLREIRFLGTKDQWEALGLDPSFEIGGAEVTFAK